MKAKRSKLWRNEQQKRVFKARMMLRSTYYDWWGAFGCPASETPHNPHWFELAKWSGMYRYRAQTCPCSCKHCSGPHYCRVDYKHETQRLIREEMEA